MCLQGILRQELGRDTAAEEAPALREGERAVGRTLDEAEPLQPLERVGVERVVEARDWQRLVEPQPEQDALGSPDRRRQLLELPRRALARRERREVATEAGRRPPAPPVDSRDRT